MPEISVIVPVYKAEAFLKKCTDSILGQTFSDLELLLVEDGSPDDSGKLCDEIAAGDPRVRVFHKENGGVSSARNLGMAEARGTYIAFSDADDWLPPDALERMYTALKNAGADSAGGAHYLAETDGSTQIEPGALPAGGKELGKIWIVVFDFHALPPWHETFRPSGAWHESPRKKAAVETGPSLPVA